MDGKALINQAHPIYLQPSTHLILQLYIQNHAEVVGIP